MKSSLVEFERKLRDRMGSIEGRPFLCDGNPYDCRVFLVGLNPGARTDFWPHWNSKDGCSKRGWLDKYRDEHGGRLGATRSRIDRMVEVMTPVKCLETNLFHAWSDNLAALPRDKRITAVFDFLMEELRPEVVFAHGRACVQYLAKRSTPSLRLDRLQEVTLFGRKVAVYPRHHLSFQCSYAECDKIATLIKGRVNRR